MMKTISVYAFTCLCGMIFVTAKEQGNKSCNYRTYVQIQLIYNSFTFLKCKNAYYKSDHWLCFFLDFSQRVVAMMNTSISIMMIIQLEKYAKVCMHTFQLYII